MNKIIIALLFFCLTSCAFAWDCSSIRSGFRTTSSDNWLGPDKLEHFSVSVPFGALGSYLARDTNHPIVYGTAIGLVPGFFKEVYDGTCHNDGFSYKDLSADLLGSLTGALLSNYTINYSRTSHGTNIRLSYHNTF